MEEGLRRPVGKGSICSPFYWVAFIRPHIQAPDLNQHNNKLAKLGFISFTGRQGKLR
jgi:hypothetical protein